MAASKVAISSIFEKKDINISYNAEAIQRSQQATDYIKKQWEMSTRQNPFMFPGDIVSVKKNRSNLKGIAIEAIHSTYDEFFETKKAEFQRTFPKEVPVRPLSVGCVTITSDKFLVLGIRNKQLALEPEKFTVVSGMVDGSDIIDQKQVDVFGCIKREMQEEIGVKPEEIEDLSCIGLIENIQHHNINIPFFAHVRVSFDRIAEREKDREFVKIIKIDNSKKSIQKALQEIDLSDIAKPTLEIYLELFRLLN